LFIPDLDPDFLPTLYPGSRESKGTGSPVPDPDPQHWILLTEEKKLIIKAVVQAALTARVRTVTVTNKFANNNKSCCSGCPDCAGAYGDGDEQVRCSCCRAQCSAPASSRQVFHHRKIRAPGRRNHFTASKPSIKALDPVLRILFPHFSAKIWQLKFYFFYLWINALLAMFSCPCCQSRKRLLP
jgi:hypothetical protein